MADAEGFEIIGDRASVGEAKSGLELEAVGAARNVFGFLIHAACPYESW